MAFINKQDTNGTKPNLLKGELGYDDYATGNDTGRVYVGTGVVNLPLARNDQVIHTTGDETKTGNLTVTNLIATNNVKTDIITNEAGTGAPSFPLGANITAATGSFFESGTFTPQIGGHTTAGTVTYTTQVGYYKKDGNKCHVEGYLTTSSAITGSAGYLSLLNFPFLHRGGHLTILCDNLNAHSGKQITATALSSALTTPRLLFRTQDVSDIVMPPISIIQNTSSVYFSGSYICE